MAERTFLLPDPGEGLTEAEILRWLVAEGEDIELNQPLVEVETSKAAIEIPSPYAGRVVTLHASVGEAVLVGDPLATFEVQAGEDGPPAAVRATPVVRKLAKDLGIDLDDLSPTDPGGRITAEDVQAAGSGTVEEVPLTATRRVIAANLQRQAAIPQVTTFRTVECSALQEFREELGVSPLPVLIAALCRTIGDHPMLNASWGGDRILVRAAVNVGIAVDTERGLVVPVLHNAGAGGVANLAGQITQLGDAARNGTLTPEQLAGATIAVSNTGSYGSEAGTPLLAPGTAVTIALGAIAPRAIVVDGDVVARPACTLSITFDHRVLDGAAVGRAVTDLVERLQSPERLRDLPR